MKVLIFGTSGIIGQYLRWAVPDSIQPIWYRQTPDPITRGVDLCDGAALATVLAEHDPQVIINLAGESRPDVVEQNPEQHDTLNVLAPIELAKWCGERGRRLIHVSSQAVLGGVQAPYEAGPSLENPVNQYGRQKLWAETQLLGKPHVTIVRPTFVLGIRPLPHVGRPNPAEQMLSGGQVKQVSDRWFSPLFASEAARLLWAIVTHDDGQRLIHLGLPRRTSRYDVAVALGVPAEPVSHDSFPGIAPRPLDTTYAAGSIRHLKTWDEGLDELRRDWQSRRDMDAVDRAREIALFFGIREDEAYGRLGKGFSFQHAEVTADFRRADPKGENALLDWYRKTEAYIWELSAYHSDPGWNYMGMCGGIVEHLRAAGARRVLCLGDGVGDLTLSLWRAGFDALYHDLAFSRTFEFAKFRFWRHTGQPLPYSCNADFQAPCFDQRIQAGEAFDAIVSLDFLEHLPAGGVEAWTAAIKAALVPGGLFSSWNAFNIGSGPNGSMPMHLSCNDRFEKDWDPLMASIGMKQLSSNWYQKAA